MKGLAKALQAAYSFGAEAYANNRKSLTKNDMEDIASYYGAQRWFDIPLEDREKLATAFYKGVSAEKNIHNRKI